MNRIDIRDRHSYLRLEYFSSSKPSLRMSNYSISPKFLDEAEIKNRNVMLVSFNCDCACTGHK